MICIKDMQHSRLRPSSQVSVSSVKTLEEADDPDSYDSGPYLAEPFGIKASGPADGQSEGDRGYLDAAAVGTHIRSVHLEPQTDVCFESWVSNLRWEQDGREWVDDGVVAMWGF